MLLQELNLVEHFDLKALGCNTAESIHRMVEAKKLAFMDREAFLGDPDFVDVPTEGLVSKEYAKERVKLIHPERMPLRACSRAIHGNISIEAKLLYLASPRPRRRGKKIQLALQLWIVGVMRFASCRAYKARSDRVS